jgi:hypothetical protein
MRVCIYTAIYGDSDDLKPQPTQTIPTDFVCFTDACHVRATAPWLIIRNDRRHHLHPRMRAKYFKILSNRLFPGGKTTLAETSFSFWSRNLLKPPYDYLVWVDGSCQIKTSHFVEKVISHVGQSSWAMFKHPERHCIYDELVVSSHMTKYGNQPIAAQVTSYRAEGYPRSNGLIAAGVIVRDTRRKDLVPVNEMWWQENLCWSYQDQLSLPVVLWRLSHQCNFIPGNLWNNELVAWRDHKLDPDTPLPPPGRSVSLRPTAELASYYNIDRIGTMEGPTQPGLDTSGERDLLINGWCLDQHAKSPAAGVDILIDGQAYAASYGLSRPDVAAYFNSVECSNTGYSLTVPARLIQPGEHRLAIRIISSDQKSYTESHTLIFNTK